MSDTSRSALIVGANRGLGLGLAREFFGRGWRVTATARDAARAEALRGLAGGGRLRLESVDIGRPEQVRGLHDRMAGERFDLLFVVAGVSGRPQDPIHAVPAEAAAQVFLTNGYWPVVFAETFADRLAQRGTVALMTSQLGSVANNTEGGWELYRASKAALNTLGRSFAARHRELTVLLLHPGWVRTDMGGPNATLDVETSARGMADVIEARHGKAGHAFVDYAGRQVPW